MRIVNVVPTVFLVGQEPGLRQLVQIEIECDGKASEVTATVISPGWSETFELGELAAGRSTRELTIQEIQEPVELRFELRDGSGGYSVQQMNWQPPKHWEVHLIQYAHHDLGYTDLPSNVLDEYDGFMDLVLDYCEETANWPEEDARFRYLCEQAWSVVHYVENRPEEYIDRLVHFVRAGQIEVTALFGNQTLELCGHEELVRLLYPSFDLKRRYGIPISSAEHNDIPGFTWGLASVLAGAGVRYFSPGVPRWYFGQGDDRVHPLWDTDAALPLGVPAACWWEGPDGARVLLWHDLHGGEWQPYDYSQAMSELPGILQGLDDTGYPFEMVSYTLRGGHRDNAPPTLRYAYLVREWNRLWAYPRLINTTNTPFLQAFERRYGERLPVLRGDVPGTDYPVAASCTPRETGVDRTTHEALMIGERFATLASLLTCYEYPRRALDKAYRESFYYDLHCWGLSEIGGPAQDGHWSEKGDRAYRAAALAHDVTLKAVNRICDEIEYPHDAYYLTIFNGLPYERDDIVRAPSHIWGACGNPMHWRDPDESRPWPVLVSGRVIGRGAINPPADLLDKPFRLVDVSTGESIPYQITSLNDPQAATPWVAERIAMSKAEGTSEYIKDIVFTARGLPALGYRTYEVVPCDTCEAQDGRGVTDGVLESEHYRVQVDLDCGAITSIYDKALGRELVDQDAPHTFGQLIVRSSETAVEELPQVSSVSLVDDGPVCTTLRIRSSASCLPRVTQEVTLYHDLKRIDVSARILRDSTPMVETYMAFPYQFEHPQFRFEAPASVMEPLVDQWPGSCTDYYGVQHWVDVFDCDSGVVWTALDTPMAEVGGLWPGYVSGAHHGVRGPGYGHPFLQPGELDRGHIYSVVSYNNFRTNFVNVQPSEFLVRYAFGGHTGDWREGRAQRFGWGVGNPPLPVWMKGPQLDGVLPAKESFCAVDAPNVALLALKQAEDGNGLIVRLWETEGKDTRVRVSMPHFGLLHAFETNLVEENQRMIGVSGDSFEAHVGPLAIATVRVMAEI